MPSRGEDTAIQVVEVLSGSLSVISCIIIFRKIWNERSNHVTNQMLLSLFFIDFVLGILYAIGRSAVLNPGICQTQAFLLQWFEVAAMLWTILMSYLMFQWIVRKRHPKRMEKIIKRFQIFIFVISFILAVILLGINSYGDTYLWCWITSDQEWRRVLFFEAILIGAWIINMIMLNLVFASIKGRFIYQKTSLHARLGNLLDSTIAIQRKLILYVSAFLFLWSFAVINRSIEFGTGKVNFIPSLLEVIFLPLQGFVNALCYGDYIDMRKMVQVTDNLSGVLFQLMDNLEHHPGSSTSATRPSTVDGGKKYYEVIVEPTKINLTKTDMIRSYIPKKYSIFSTTLNVGEASLQSIVGEIKDWIVEGHE
jgi:hypothetical protein